MYPVDTKSANCLRRQKTALARLNYRLAMTVNGAALSNLPADRNIFFVLISDNFRWLQRSSSNIVNLRDIIQKTIKIFAVYFLSK